MNERFNEILTDEALEFLRQLHENFNEKRKQLLENRKTIQEKLSAQIF